MMKDLLVLVPDENMKQAVEALLQKRHEALGIRPITVEVHKHPRHDPGVYLQGHDFIRRHSSSFSYALVLFDFEGCGCATSPSDAADGVKEKLAQTGWRDRSHVIVIDPELETWVWSDSPHVASAFGWQEGELKVWLQGKKVDLSLVYCPIISFT